MICSHFLQDIRYLLFAFGEQMNRVGKAGYIECPSRFLNAPRRVPTTSTGVMTITAGLSM